MTKGGENDYFLPPTFWFAAGVSHMFKWTLKSQGSKIQVMKSVDYKAKVGQRMDFMARKEREQMYIPVKHLICPLKITVESKY